MNRFYYLVILAIALCVSLTFLCASASAQASVYPDGLHGPSDVLYGIYPGTDRGNCCWLSERGAFAVRVPHGADTLLLNVIEPDYAVPTGNQSLRVRVNDSPEQRRCCFGAGEYEFTFQLPRDVGARPLLTVHLSAGRTFVPRDIGLNQDPRHLSLIIRSIAFSNSATGERILNSPLPAFQSAPIIWVVLAGAVILAVTLRRPIYGLLALILTDPFLMAHTIAGTTITLPKAALIAVALGLLLRVRTWPSLNTSAVRMLLTAQILVILSMALSSWHAANHGAALRETLRDAQYAATLVVAYVAYRVDPDDYWIRLTVAVVTAIVSLAALAQELLGAPEGEMVAGHVIARIAGPLEGPNQLAGYLGIVVPVMLAFALARPALAIERIAIALGYVACVLTFSKAGIFALAVGTALLLAIRYAPQHRRLTAAVTAVVFAALFGLATASFAGVLHGPAERVFGSTTAADRFNGGLGVRSDLWHGASEMWRAHPLLGVGPGNYELQIGRYDPGVRTHANGMFFQVLAEQGAVGFIAMLAVVGASIGVFVRYLDEPLALGACIAAVAMTFHQVFDCMWLYTKVGVMWWLVLAIGASAVALRERTKNVAERAVA
jgi:O-antigen ligase